MMTAVDAVFNTAELFEEILLQLRPITLLPLQRVNKKWKRAIEASPTIQEELFLRPTSVNTTVCIPIYPFWRDENTPSFVMGSIIGSPPMRRNAYVRGSYIDRTELPEGSRPDDSPSWRNMLISQPAPDQVVFIHDEACLTYEGPRDIVVTNAEGVRLGQILDELNQPGSSLTSTTTDSMRAIQLQTEDSY